MAPPSFEGSVSCGSSFLAKRFRQHIDGVFRHVRNNGRTPTQLGLLERFHQTLKTKEISPAVKAWLAQHKRFVFHFTPTSASWMNQIEIWFGIHTRQAVRRGSIGSVKQLTRAIDEFTRAWNDRAAPFTWIKTAGQILQSHPEA